MKLVVLTFGLMLAILIGVALQPAVPRAHSEQRITDVPVTPATAEPFPTLTPFPIGYLPPATPTPPPPYPAPASVSAPSFRLFFPSVNGPGS